MSARAPGWWRARPLSERETATPGTRGEGERLAQRWREGLPDEDTLLVRLRASGLDPADLPRLLDQEDPPPGAEPPSWWSELMAALPPGGRTGIADAEDAVDAELVGGCLRLVVPLVQPVRERLAERAQRLADATAQGAFAPPEAARLLAWPLAAELAELCAPAVAFELQAARAAGALTGADGRERAARFLRDLGRAERARELLDEHPVLARLAHERLALGEQAAAELLDRLSADWSALRAGPLAGLHRGPLEAVVPLGDAHDGGRRVLLLRFAGGARVIYKPRSLATEAAYARLLERLGRLGLDPAPSTPAVLAEGRHHGWQRCVEPADCASAGAVERYFHRLGSQLAALHALRAVDVHHENVIAAGEQPFVVDLECLLHPRLGGVRAATADPPIAETGQGCVLRVGLLPRADEIFGADLAGLGRDPAARAQVEDVGWSGEDGEDPRRVRRTVELTPGANVPRLDGRPVRPHEHLEALAAGFAAAHRLLTDHGAALESELAGLVDAPVRVILRPTKVYADLLTRAGQPDCLDDGPAREEALNALWRGAARRSDLRAAAAAETYDLWRGDVPKITTRPGSPDGHHHALGRLPGMLAPHSSPTVGEALAGLDGDDRERQVGFVRAAVRAAAADLPEARGPAPPSTSPPDASQATAAAQEVGRRLRVLALHDGEQAGWLAAQSGPGHPARVLRPLGPGLAEGQAGVAVFLAELALHTGEAETGALARAAVRRLLAQVGRGWAADADLGLWRGAGGVLWALARLSVTLDEPTLGAEGLTLALAGATRAESAADVDLAGGLAGWATGVASVLAVADEPGLQAHAARCAERLAADDTLSAPGLLHGEAGRSLALVHLGHPATGPRPSSPADSERGSGDASWASGAAGRTVAASALGCAPARSAPLPLAAADHSLAGGHLGVALAFADRGLAGGLMEEIERDGLRCPGPGGVEVPGLLTGLAGAGWAWLALTRADTTNGPDPLLALQSPAPPSQ